MTRSSFRRRFGNVLFRHLWRSMFESKVAKNRGRLVMSKNGGAPALKGPYRQIFDELRSRTIAPAMHPSFVVYFVLAVSGLGALGVWLELYAYIYPEPSVYPRQRSDSLRTAILTFFPAVAGTAAMQLLWAESTKHFRSVAFAILGIFLLLALIVSPSRITNASALFVGVTASLVSLWVWWIANAKQPDLLDNFNPSTPVGGEPGTALPGSVAGYQV